MIESDDKCPACNHDWHGAALCNERVEVVNSQQPYDLPLFVPLDQLTIGRVNTVPASCACRG